MTSPHPRVILKKRCENSPGNSPLWARFRKEASQKKRRLLFAEAIDRRVLSAVCFLESNGIAQPVLVGNPLEVRKAAQEGGWDLKNIEIIDPQSSSDTKKYQEQLYEKRRSKGDSLETIAVLLQDPLYFAAMVLANDGADALIVGAVRTTADTVKATFSCVGRKSHSGIAYGIFFMECPHSKGGPRYFLFADSAVSPRPSFRSLASIGIGSAEVYRRFFREEPHVAYLSFSTMGSAEDESVDLVRQAVDLVRKKEPALEVQGEIQVDAALVPDIGRQKGVSSPFVGLSNVMIFPDLNAGNIAYKFMQHLGGARAVGPLLMGLKKPITDLSRGCSDEDIVDAAAVVSLVASEERLEE